MNINLSSIAVVLLWNFVTINPAVAQVGQCVDTDGDGFGWNGVETCDPAGNTNIAVGMQSGLPGACVDTDGDGFGWNGVETCDPTSSVQSVNPVQSGTASLAIPIAGTWYCQSQIVTSQFFDPGVSRSGPVVNDTVQWVREGIFISTAENFPDATPPSCVSRNGTLDLATSRYVFEDDGSLTISSNLRRFSSCESNPAVDIFDRTDFGSWSFDGNSITVNGTVMREFGVEYKSVFPETVFVDDADRPGPSNF